MDNLNRFYIYVHNRLDTNLPFYIGKGCGGRAFSKASRNKWWKNIVQKCGYEVIIIEQNLSEEDAFELETQHIKLFRKLGYELTNMTAGGEGASGYKHTHEALEKMRAFGLTRTHTEESKAKMRASQASVQRPEGVMTKAVAAAVLVNTGKKLSKETRVKQSRSMNSPRIRCSNGMVFDILSDASKFVSGSEDYKVYSKHSGDIGKCCKGKRKTAYGFTWSYVEETTN